jgi:hypothetical protein
MAGNRHGWLSCSSGSGRVKSIFIPDPYAPPIHTTNIMSTELSIVCWLLLFFFIRKIKNSNKLLCRPTVVVVVVVYILRWSWTWDHTVFHTHTNRHGLNWLGLVWLLCQNIPFLSLKNWQNNKQPNQIKHPDCLCGHVFERER